MKKRKYIRIALTPDDYERLKEAKGIAEEGFAMHLTDTQFALALIRRALRH